MYYSQSGFCGLFPLNSKSRKIVDCMISTKGVLFTILNWGLQNGSTLPSPPTGTQYIYCCTRIAISVQSVAYQLPL